MLNRDAGKKLGGRCGLVIDENGFGQTSRAEVEKLYGCRKKHGRDGKFDLIFSLKYKFPL